MIFNFWFVMYIRLALIIESYCVKNCQPQWELIVELSNMGAMLANTLSFLKEKYIIQRKVKLSQKQ